MFIVIVLKRKSSYYIIAEKWLKRNKIMSGIWCEWLCGRVLERVGVVYVPSGKVGQRGDQRRVPVLAGSRNMAKTD